MSSGTEMRSAIASIEGPSWRESSKIGKVQFGVLVTSLPSSPKHRSSLKISLISKALFSTVQTCC